LGRLSHDETFLIAVNIAKLPTVPRQILKDIARPPNSASRDDSISCSTALSPISYITTIIDSGSAAGVDGRECCAPGCNRRAAHARSESDNSFSGSVPPAELPKMLSADGFDAFWAGKAWI
jgi:hypothetical protein